MPIGSRKVFMRVTTLFLIFCSLLLGQKPNVLFIPVDDLNAWVGHLKAHPNAKTPNIDRLAARGMTFTRAYTPVPACSPTRAALLTGKRPWTSGVYVNEQQWYPTLKSTTSLPQHFMKSGYQVMGGGKIFHNGIPGHTVPNYWHEYYTRKADPSAPQKPTFSRGKFAFGPLLNISETEMPDYKLVTWASEKLKKQHSKPFFLAVGIIKPHLPWFVPKKYFDRFPLNSIQRPPNRPDDLNDIPSLGVKMALRFGDHAAILQKSAWEKAIQAYLANISFVDDQIGRLLDALDNGPNKNNTIIVFWGDHGWSLGEKRHWRKFALWEEATRAPLIFVVPGQVNPGSRCDTPIDFMSIYPTLTDLAGISTPAHVEGNSLAPLLHNPAAGWSHPAISTHGGGNHAVRSGGWRYIRYSNGTEELYNRYSDPNEWNNLASDPSTAGTRVALRNLLPTHEATPVRDVVSENKD